MLLVFCFEMCLSMEAISNNIILGIIIGIIGIIGVGLNYPIYKKILEESKKKYSYDIITLANQITNENK